MHINAGHNKELMVNRPLPIFNNNIFLSSTIDKYDFFSYHTINKITKRSAC